MNWITAKTTDKKLEPDHDSSMGYDVARTSGTRVERTSVISVNIVLFSDLGGQAIDSA